MVKFSPDVVDNLLSFAANRVSPNFDKNWVVALLSVTLLENSLRKKLVELGVPYQEVKKMSYEQIAEKLGSKFSDIDLPKLIGLIKQRNIAVHEVYRHRISMDTANEARLFLLAFIDRLYLPTNVLPRITITPRVGVAGELVGLVGTGFDRSGELKLYFHGIELSSKFFFSEDGELMCSFRVPDVPGGVSTVTLVDSSRRTATQAFTVLPHSRKQSEEKFQKTE